MPFEKKTWKNRQTQHPNRRKLTKVSGDNYDVTRAEGTVTEQGDMFNAQNMNDLETRIESGLNDKLSKAKFTSINMAGEFVFTNADQLVRNFYVPANTYFSITLTQVYSNSPPRSVSIKQENGQYASNWTQYSGAIMLSTELSGYTSENTNLQLRGSCQVASAKNRYTISGFTIGMG